MVLLMLMTHPIYNRKIVEEYVETNGKRVTSDYIDLSGILGRKPLPNANVYLKFLSFLITPSRTRTRLLPPPTNHYR